MGSYFYDSYAVIEYLNANPAFIPYFEEHTGMLSLLNILEIYYSVLNDVNQEKADTVLMTILPLQINPTEETIKKAMLFRQKHKKNNLSYADCLGYQLALEKGIKFLTGDRQFKDIANVEFLQASQ